MADPPTPRLPDPSKRRASRPAGRSEEQANVATFAALIGLGLLAFALIGLVALILPQFRGLVLVFLGAVGFFAIHYVVWGWWLPKAMRQDDETE